VTTDYCHPRMIGRAIVYLFILNPKFHLSFKWQITSPRLTLDQIAVFMGVGKNQLQFPQVA
jgi:hypothetical protein